MSTSANGVNHLQGGFWELSMLSHEQSWESALWHKGQKCMIIEHPSPHNTLIFTVRRGNQVKPLCQILNWEILILLLKGGGNSQEELWLEIHTILPHKNKLLNRQNKHTTVILSKASLSALYTTLYPSFTKHQQKISRHVYGGQPR